MRYRQVHLDFHTSEHIKDIGQKFDKNQFQAALKLGHVDSITLFAKCHHGWGYFNSKTIPMHPNLNFDLLSAQVEAAAEIGVSNKIYVSGGFDERLAVEHTDWLVRKKDERLVWASDFSKAGYHKICMNSPYLDILCDQIKEVCQRFNTDGIFVDIANVQVCYCQNCVKIMRSEGKDPYDDNNAQELAERTYKKYARRIREAIDSVNPRLSLFHNGGHVWRGRRDLAALSTHLEIEALPTGIWGYTYFPASARYFQKLGVDMLGMTGKFHTSWGEFGGFKHPNALRYEIALNAANGAKSSVGDQLHPQGEMDMETYRLIGLAYGELEAKEPWLEGAEPIADIGVISNEAINPRDKSKAKADDGVIKILHEGHYLYNMLDEESNFEEYKLIILPDYIGVSQKLSDKLKRYCRNGGKIIATGVSGLDDSGDFVCGVGARYLGEQPYSAVYFHPQKYGDLLADTKYVIYTGAIHSEAISSENLLIPMESPYFERTTEHFCSHLHSPDSGIFCGAGMTEGEDGIYISAHIFMEYIERGSLISKNLVLYAIERLLKDKKTLEIALPSQGVVTLMRQAEEGRYVCHALYASPILRGSGIQVIEDIVPIYNVPLKLKIEEKIKNVYIAPNGENIKYEQTLDGVNLNIPCIDCHTMIVLEY